MSSLNLNYPDPPHYTIGYSFLLAYDTIDGVSGDPMTIQTYDALSGWYMVQNDSTKSLCVMLESEIDKMHSQQATTTTSTSTTPGFLTFNLTSSDPIRNAKLQGLTGGVTSRAKPPKAAAKPAGPPAPAIVPFESVVMDDDKREQILEALEQIYQQDLIFNKWGFHETIEKGKGVSMLFFGPPGTGKTLMAQAVADKLGYKLKVVSTAEIESSEPGAAERNIRAQFAGAKRNGKMVLLFDECDSLIYDRSNVGSILASQVNELLSSLEKYDGITIFTTNRLGTLDEAFNRRLALKLKFDLPNREQRAEIWKRMFPKKAPVHKEVDWHRLAVVEISGGYIKNAVLRGVRIAAAEKMPDKKKQIKMHHLVKALKLEAESMVEFQQARNEMPMRAGPLGRGASLGRSRGEIVKEMGRTMETISSINEEEESEDE